MASNIAPVKQRTDDLTDEHKLQAQFALAAFATIKAKNVGYVSIPITSGRRLYDYIEEKGFHSVEEARADHAAFFRNVMTPNFQDGIRVSNDWASRLDGAIVAPVEFEKHLRSHSQIDWGQDDFMGMWIPLIKEKITQMIMINGWEYSNGSGEEYLQAALMQMGRGDRSNITVNDEQGKPINLEKGIKLLADSFIDVTQRGIKARNMAETLGIILEAEQRFNREQTTGVPESPRRQGAKPSAAPYNHAAVAAIGDQVRAILRRDYPDVLPTLKKISSYDYSPLNALFRVRKDSTPAPVLAA